MEVGQAVGQGAVSSGFHAVDFSSGTGKLVFFKKNASQRSVLMRMCTQVGWPGLSACRRHLLTIELGPKLLETIPVRLPAVTDPNTWFFNMLTIVSGEP